MSNLPRNDAAYDPSLDSAGGDTRSYVDNDRRGGPQVVADEQADLGLGAKSSSEMDSDAQLKRDEKEAIDTRNIMGGEDQGIQTRGVKTDYREPGDEEGLPGRGDTGSSSVRTGSI